MLKEAYGSTRISSAGASISFHKKKSLRPIYGDRSIFFFVADQIVHRDLEKVRKSDERSKGRLCFSALVSGDHVL